MAKITAYPIRTVPEATDRFIVADPESLENFGVSFVALADAAIARIVTVENNGNPEVVFDQNIDLVTSDVT